MSVKKILARRYAGFLSLDQVLGQMAKSSGSTYQECAAALYILLQDFPDTAPSWQSKDLLQGISKTSAAEQSSALKTLKRIAETGYPDDGVPF